MSLTLQKLLDRINKAKDKLTMVFVCQENKLAATDKEDIKELTVEHHPERIIGFYGVNVSAVWLANDLRAAGFALE